MAIEVLLRSNQKWTISFIKKQHTRYLFSSTDSGDLNYVLDYFKAYRGIMLSPLHYSLSAYWRP